MENENACDITVEPNVPVARFRVGDGIGLRNGIRAGTIIESRPSTRGLNKWYLKWEWHEGLPERAKSPFGEYDGWSDTTDTRHYYVDFVIHEDPV